MEAVVENYMADNFRVKVMNLLYQTSDIEVLKAIAENTSKILKEMLAKPKSKVVEDDPFACFSGDWGGDRDPHEIADEIHNSHCFTREVESL